MIIQGSIARPCLTIYCLREYSIHVRSLHLISLDVGPSHVEKLVAKTRLAANVYIRAAVLRVTKQRWTVELAGQVAVVGLASRG